MTLSLVLLQIAAWLHLCQVPGTWFLAKRIVGIADELPRLSPLVAAIVTVLGLAVMAVLVGLGVLVGTHPSDVLGTRFGLALCGCLGGCWLARLGVQFWYYFGFAWPRSRSARAAHAALVGIFATQALGYLGVWVLGVAE
jgi:hypothetical protein